MSENISVIKNGLQVDGSITGSIFSGSAFYGDGSNLTGISSPTPTLDAVTAEGSTTTNTITAGGYTTSGGPLLLSGTGTYQVGVSNGTGAQLWLTTRDGSTNQAKKYVITGNTANDIYHYWFRGASGSEVELMRLVGNGGNLLIGTTTDGARLRVKGSGTTSSTTALRVENSSASPSLVVLDDGKVGIRTATPSYNFDVLGTTRIQKYGDSTLIVQETQNNNAVWIRTQWYGADQSLYFNATDFSIKHNSTVGGFGYGAIINMKSNGNVQIGTTTDAGYKLDVNGSLRATTLYGDGSNLTGISSATPTLDAVTTEGNTTSNSITIGNLTVEGSDTSASTKNFHVKTGNGTSIMDFRNDTYAFFGCGQGGGSASGFIFRYSSPGVTQFAGYNYGNGTSPSYQPIYLDTDSTGRSQGIFINYASGSAPGSTEFAVRGTGTTSSTFTAKFQDSNSTDVFTILDNGDVRAAGDITAYYSSDKNLKTNIQPLESPIEKIKQVGGYEFDWKPESGKSGKDIGVIAQEIEEILPEIVTTRESGYKAVRYEKIIPLLIECIKDQQDQIDELKSRL